MPLWCGQRQIYYFTVIFAENMYLYQICLFFSMNSVPEIFHFTKVQVKFQASPSGVSRQSGTGNRFLSEYFGFFPPVSIIPQMLHNLIPFIYHRRRAIPAFDKVAKQRTLVASMNVIRAGLHMGGNACATSRGFRYSHPVFSRTKQLRGAI